ncbi:MAG: GNAT family N-acetyltransferase [Lachnospiraceae bacterium]|nr:GNAT family N-acetyltransferase [Lachnospiraceae bacterium]
MICKPDISLRKATIQDAELLFRWANDETVRRNSFSSRRIEWDEHLNWFKRVLNDEDVYQYILMNKDVPIGQIRLTVNESEAEIGYSIDSAYRGKGFGSVMLKMAEEMLGRERPDVDRIVGRVKPENKASLAVFEGLGYTEEFRQMVFVRENTFQG